MRAFALNVTLSPPTPGPRVAAGARASGGDGVAAGLRRGDHAALDEFYRDWFERAVALVAARTGRDEAFCLDSVQDAFVRLVGRGPPSWADSREALDAWFVRVVHTSALDRLRADSRRAMRDRGVHVRGGEAARPADAAALAETVRRLEAMVAELERTEYAMLRARADAGLGLAQIGTALGLTVGAVHGRLRRIAARLGAAAQNDRRPRREDR